MPRQRSSAPEPSLVDQDGGLVTHFVNSTNAKRPGIASYAELLAWGELAGELAAADVLRLTRRAAARPGDADAVLARALELRGGLERIVTGLAARRRPKPGDLDGFHRELAIALPCRFLVPSEDGYRWAWGDRGGDDLDRILWPVAMAMADLLTSKYWRQVHRCAGEKCGLFFVDRSPGSPRKWCSQTSCGRKVRASKHYRRTVRPRRLKIEQMQRRRRALRFARNDSEDAS